MTNTNTNTSAFVNGVFYAQVRNVQVAVKTAPRMSTQQMRIALAAAKH